MTESGYLHPAYVAALDYGVPRRLPRSGGWLVERAIEGTSHRDAMGPYPLFCCADWRFLRDDLDELSGEVVAVSIVTDPFSTYGLDQLQTCFPDLTRPFKDHYVVDLQIPVDQVWHEHHRRNERRGLGNVAVERVDDVDRYVEDWIAMYAVLVKKHDVSGFAAFSDRSLVLQLKVPGSIVFRASRNGTTVGMIVWYLQGCTAYYHLGAYTEEGYDLRASYALFSTAIRHFAAAGLRWLNLGAAPGLQDDPSAGLARFKRGWSTGTRPTYLCGRVFDVEAYAALRESTNTLASAYFPAYREGDLR